MNEAVFGLTVFRLGVSSMDGGGRQGTVVGKMGGFSGGGVDVDGERMVVVERGGEAWWWKGGKGERKGMLWGSSRERVERWAEIILRRREWSGEVAEASSLAQ